MTHPYTAEDWFEFAANSALADQQSRMQHHLDGGCEPCRKALDLWQEVLAIGGRGATYRPSGATIQLAKGLFERRQRFRWLPALAEMARLIFDGRVDPLPAAARGMTGSNLQFLQEAKPYVVDFHINREPARRRIRLIGQILKSGDPGEDFSEAEIFLLKEEDLVINIMASGTGEFELEFSDEKNLQMFIDVRGRKIIEILLPDWSAMAK